MSELLQRISSEEITEWMALFYMREKEQKEAERKANQNQSNRKRR